MNRGVWSPVREHVVVVSILERVEFQPKADGILGPTCEAQFVLGSIRLRRVGADGPR